MMGHFPLFLDLSGKTILVVGTTPAAREKMERLSPFGGTLLQVETYSEEDLEIPPVLVIAALADREENARVSGACQARNIPVNVVDDPELCSFFFPALITRGALSVGISTAGKSPAAASLLRQRVEEQIPGRIDEILDWSQELRLQAQSAICDPTARAAFLRRCIAEAMIQNRPLSDEETALLMP